MTVTIPDNVVRGMTEQDLKVELAIFLFTQYKMTLGQAARFAGMLQVDFQKLLGSRRIPIHYGVRELEEDVATLKGMGML